MGLSLLSEYWARRFRTSGAAVLSVQEGRPAADAGMVGIREDWRGNIHLGDVIIAVDDEPVTNEDTLLSLLEQHEPGDMVTVTTMRDDKVRHYEIKLEAPR